MKTPPMPSDRRTGLEAAAAVIRLALREALDARGGKKGTSKKRQK